MRGMGEQITQRKERSWQVREIKAGFLEEVGLVLRAEITWIEPNTQGLREGLGGTGIHY